MNKNLKIIFFLPILLLFTSSQKTEEDYFEISKNLKLMASVYEKVNTFYVDEVSPGKVMKDGIDAMLKSLDPYTVYISESQIEDFRFTTTGEYGGVGATIKVREGKMIISELYENSPAFKSGLSPGDLIISIDNISIDKKSLEEVGSLLKGPAGSKTELKIQRNNKKQLVIVEREDIQIPAVNFKKKITNNTGIIKLSSFTSTASTEFKEALTQLKKENIDNLIIDLRSNGGGLLNEAVKIVNLFIPKGEVVVKTKSRIPEMNRTYTTQEQPTALDIPLIVLIDEMSASASEIVAGSLQDLDRAIIIGNTSYGKGLVQQTKQVSFGGQIKLTVAKYYTPSGRCIQKIDYSKEKGPSNKIADSLVKNFKTRNGRSVTDSRGVEPDIKVDQEYFNAITEALLLEDVIFNYVNKIYPYFKQDDSLNPTTFSLNDSIYESFTQYVSNKEITYQTKSNFHLEELKEVAVKEKYLEENIQLFLKMDSVFKTDISRDLIKYKEEIKFFLENELISRKHFQKGRVEASLKQDPYIKKSLEIFSNDSLSKVILGN